MVTKLPSKWNSSSWITNPRVLWGIFLLSITPLFLVGLYYTYRDEQLRVREYEVMRLERKAAPLVQLLQKREKIVSELRGVERDYIQKHLEPLTFLEQDITILTQIYKNSNYKPITERLTFLTGDVNKMKFQKIATRKIGMMEESVWALDHPVEINFSDFQKILFAIGNAKAGLAIKKCLCTKTNSLYKLDLELIERTLYEKI